MYAQLADTELYFERHGKGIPTFILHGGLGWDHTYFRPWLDKLGNQAELIYYDHRANGRSTRPDTFEGVDIDTWVADIEALRQYFGFDRIALFGHSSGGFIAQEYALRFDGHLAGLILCSSAPAMDYAPSILANAAGRGTPEQLAALGEVFSRQMTDDDDFRSIFKLLLPMYFKQYVPHIVKSIDENTSYSAAAWNHFFATCVPNFTTVERLCSLLTPTLILCGADDWIMPQGQSERMHTALTNAELVIFENSGHFPFIEETDRFARVTGDWLSALNYT
jgi:proline iminopeptidase